MARGGRACAESVQGSQPQHHTDFSLMRLREHRQPGWEARDTPAGARAALALKTPPGTLLQETLSTLPYPGPRPLPEAPAQDQET